MDGQRFDDLTRLLGASGSRRQALRLLAGSALAVVGLGSRRGISRGQDGCLGNDESCDKDDECCTGICSASLCVCRIEGEPCATSSDCCADGVDELTCVDGLCAQPTCTRGDHDCGRYGPCCSGACVGEGALVCVEITCRDIGDCPTNAADCVGGLCVRGTCDVDFFCPPGLTCVDGGCVELCADPGAACGESGPTCCGDLICVEGICAEQMTCAPGGAPCMVDIDCCAGLTCADGACRPPVPPDPDPGDPDPVIPDPVTPGPDIPPEEPAGDSVTLPNTGIGSGQNGDNAAAGVMLAGGAAALLAAKKRRPAGHPADRAGTPTEIPPPV